MKRITQLCLTLILSLTVWGACSDSGGDRSAGGSTVDETAPLVVYSGRNESLVGPILEQFREVSGLAVEVRYGDTAELAATLLEEGEHTPADLFFSQDAAALGAVAEAGRFRPLPSAVLERVPPRFRSPDGHWVGVSGRARSVVYNPDLIQLEELPQSMEEVLEPRYRGTFGVAPTNSSFQAHLAVMETAAGRDMLETWLEALVANEPQLYPKNSPIVEAVIAGEIEWGLVNHYYLWRALKENPDARARNFFMPEGPVSSFVNVAGVGALSSRPEVGRLVEFLLSDRAQSYFAEQTYEYPLVASVSPSVDLPGLDAVRTPEVDFAVVSANLESTLAALQESGLLQ